VSRAPSWTKPLVGSITAPDSRVGWGFDDDRPVDPRVMLEAENGVRQARRLAILIRDGLAAADEPVLTPATLDELNRLAVEGLVNSAGRVRNRSDLEISGSRHVPPPYEDVPRLVDEACAVVRQRWHEDPLFLAAYVLWRVCWIHPFDDGNGRTARAASYLVLCVCLGFELPGRLPIPARIKHAPIAYTRALEAADSAWANGVLDVSAMQRLLAFYLEAQLNDAPPCVPP
jgi:Fic family protein